MWEKGQSLDVRGLVNSSYGVVEQETDRRNMHKIVCNMVKVLGGEVVDSQVSDLSLWFVLLSTSTGNIHKEMSITLISCFRQHAPNIVVACFDIHHLITVSTLSHSSSSTSSLPWEMGNNITKESNLLQGISPQGFTYDQIAPQKSFRELLG